MTSFLSSVIDDFLVRHGFASGKRGAEEDHEPPTKKRKVIAESMILSMAQNTISAPASQKSGAPPLYIRPVSNFENISFDLRPTVIEREKSVKKFHKRLLGKILLPVKHSLWMLVAGTHILKSRATSLMKRTRLV